MSGKFALLIGNDKYKDGRFSALTVPRADVEALQAILNRPDISGFDRVDSLLNGSLEAVMHAIGDLFADKARDDLVLLYFSGHGALDNAGQLYLALSHTRHDRLSATALWSSNIKNEMDNSRSRRQVLILDCCHAGAFGRAAMGAKSAGGQQALTEATFEVKGYGREILTASAATQLSWEGNQVIGETDKSLFTHYLVEGLETGQAAPEGSDAITVGQLYEYVHDKVVQVRPTMTPQRWVDQQQSSIVIARNPKPGVKPAALPEALLRDLEDENYRTRLGAVHELRWLIKEGSEAERLAALVALEAHKDKERDRIVYAEIEKLIMARTTVEPSVVTTPKADDSKVEVPRKAPIEPSEVFRDTLEDGSQGPEMVVIPAGTFTMGSPATEKKRSDWEGPQHEVTYTGPFAMGRYAVTFEEYDRFVEASGRERPDDEGWGRGRQPMIHVSWHDALAYAEWLSKQTGKRYRLPGEAEWEYAARAGSTTAYWWGDEVGQDRANCNGCGSQWDGKQSAPVGSFKTNAFGLHDTSGNVWEWVQDCWHKNYENAPEDGSAWLEANRGNCALRVIRGGSWNFRPWVIRSAARNRGNADFRDNDLGFRLAQGL